MDAALNGFDVGHIAIAKTALEEINPLIDLNTPIMQLMEKLRIDVIRTVPKTTISLATPAPVSIPDNPAPSPAIPTSGAPSPASSGAPLD
jgi:hypothetical protein